MVLRLMAIGVVIIVHRDHHLPHIVDALNAARRLARRLHCRKQERYQDADDGDHDQELDERKTV